MNRIPQIDILVPSAGCTAIVDGLSRSGFATLSTRMATLLLHDPRRPGVLMPLELAAQVFDLLIRTLEPSRYPFLVNLIEATRDKDPETAARFLLIAVEADPLMLLKLKDGANRWWFDLAAATAADEPGSARAHLKQFLDRPEILLDPKTREAWVDGLLAHTLQKAAKA